jgi:hypothetical protein
METTGTIEQFREILVYLSSKQVEARHTALDIILGYSATTEHLSMWKTTEVSK